MSQYFASDFHFGHRKILEYCKRPFATIEEHDAEILRRINLTVMPDDELYILGDVAFVDPRPYMAQLNVRRKYLILGNHDQCKPRPKELHECGFNWIKEVHGIEIEGIPIWLSHYPHASWPASHHGTWHLHGHSHGGTPNTESRYDVGVDTNNFTPISFPQLRLKLSVPIRRGRDEVKNS